MTTLDLTTIQVDDFSLIELTKREGGGFNLTLHVGSEESGRWDDLSIGLPASKAAALADALEQGVGVTDAMIDAAGHFRWGPDWSGKLDKEDWGNTRSLLVAALSASCASHPAAVGEAGATISDDELRKALRHRASLPETTPTDSYVMMKAEQRIGAIASNSEPAMVRICPERDGRCPHGIDCPFAINRGSCDMIASRAALVDLDRVKPAEYQPSRGPQ